MKNLRRLSKIFTYAAIVTHVVAWLIYIESVGGQIQVFGTDEQGYVGMYILFMIPVIFAAMAVSLRFIAKAIDPDYKSGGSKQHEPPLVLPPD